VLAAIVLAVITLAVLVARVLMGKVDRCTEEQGGTLTLGEEEQRAERRGSALLMPWSSLWENLKLLNCSRASAADLWSLNSTNPTVLLWTVQRHHGEKGRVRWVKRE
jgi:hypothetical protein